MKKALKILRNLFFTLVALILLLMVLINFSSVQTFLAQRATAYLSKQLNTKVAVQNVRIDLLNHILLEQLYVEDQNKDTLAFIGKAEVRITDWFFLKAGTPVLHYIGLNDAYVHLYRSAKSNAWNYDFIAEAFDGGSNTSKKTGNNNFKIDLEKILINNVRFHMDDAWGGYDYDIDIGEFAGNIKEFNLTKKRANIDNLSLSESSIRLRDYPGGKAPSPKKPKTIDSTPFNPQMWQIQLDAVKLADCHFKFVSKETAPYPNEFDYQHIDVSNLNTDIKHLKINGDTITAQVELLSLRERSGFEIKEFQSYVTVSPNASICEKLFLKTNNSKISDYYAMHYTRFPDFEDYIDKVWMEGKLNNADIDPKDIAYFAPQLREINLFKSKVSGWIQGTVRELHIKNVDATDGFSSIKGELKIQGLPDMEQTIFDMQNAEIITTGNSVLKYAPMLKDNESLDLTAIEFAYFKGSFKGKINDFTAQGTLKSNLGNIDADIAMVLPEHQPAQYSGTIISQAFDAGKLLRQPQLGKTSLNASLQGASFDIDGIHIKATTTIQDIDFNGYTYRDIIADGIFDKKRFDGKLLINDSNISMGFYGSIDLHEKDKITINATANLLNSNLHKLNFSKVPTTLTADFDLNCSGKDIDDFIGTAKLYNINLRRNSKRVDLDSVNIRSYMEDLEKHIDIESNLLSAKIKGTFLLSELPHSTQYFLSQYLPSYIETNNVARENQDINFHIQTAQVNNLIKAFSDEVSGFDKASFDGGLNTNKQTIRLDASIPEAHIGNTHFYKSEIHGSGNYNKLQVKTNIESLVLGANLLNTSLQLDAELGHDSLAYTIATKSEDEIGTASLSGNIIAKSDTLYGSFSSSEFFINNSKWEIPSGNAFIYAENYLHINNLQLNSALQKVYINSHDDMDKQRIRINTQNIDIGQLAALSPISSYQLDGRVNGDLEIEELFGKMQLISNLEASGVKLLGDTVGTVKIVGHYDAPNNEIIIDPKSGVFNNHFSLSTNGNIALNERNKDQLNTHINIDNFPVKFLSPFLEGYVQNLDGLANGDINIGGTFKKPNLNGTLNLKNIAAKVDYIGAFYTIPLGKISMSDQTITLEDIELYDVYKNTAIASGTVRFKNLNNPTLNIRLKTDKFEVVNLKDYENDLFYGHVIAKTDFNISGTVSDMRMNISATPVAKSTIYIPYNAAGDYSTNTYITFKSYGEADKPKETKSNNKLSVRINATMNDYLGVNLILDPISGDNISATGYGNLSIDVPANDNYSMFGKYNIEHGSYTFTFRQVLSKTFTIKEGSSIQFSGAIDNTGLDIFASYSTKARLYDLLNSNQLEQLRDNTKELDDAKTAQNVNVLLRMNGTLASPNLDYEIELPEKRSIGTTAYNNLTQINQSDKSALTNQVSALLFLGSFMPSQGITSTMAVTGAKNTLGETIASQASPLLTNALNKLLGDQKLEVMLNYKSYGQDITQAGGTSAIDSRNEVKFGLKKNYFNDRLSLQVGSAYDWGRPTSSNQSSSNFNLAGDFRAQYLLTPDGGVSIVGFRASNYDLFYGYNIARTGLGISFRKNFDNLYEFFHSRKKIQEERSTENKKGVQP